MSSLKNHTPNFWGVVFLVILFHVCAALCVWVSMIFIPITALVFILMTAYGIVVFSNAGWFD